MRHTGADFVLEKSGVDKLMHGTAGDVVGGAREELLAPGSADAPSSGGPCAAGRSALAFVTGLARFLCCGEERPRVARFLVLFRRRYPAAVCVGVTRWPGELINVPGVVRMQPAPAPADMYWPNLLKPLTRLRANYLAGLALTWALFLFWTIPVAAAQSLATVRDLAQLPGLGGLADAIERAGDDTVAFVEGMLASAVLQGAMFLTLYSGLFPWLNRLLGALSQTEISRMTVERMCLFQILLVLLASAILSSVFGSLQQVLEDPTHLPTTLAQNIPSQSSFFQHYMLNSLLFVCLLDLTQIAALLSHTFCARSGEKGSQPRRASEAARAQRLHILYSKLVLTAAIALTFFAIAPLTPLVAVLYFVPAYYLYAVILREVDGAPDVDTGGACWESAMLMENLALILAQLLLLGVLVLKHSVPGTVLCAIAIVYSGIRCYRVRRHYIGEASALALQRCVQLEQGSPTYSSLRPYCIHPHERQPSPAG